jgi:hypothetical protein
VGLEGATLKPVLLAFALALVGCSADQTVRGAIAPFPTQPVLVGRTRLFVREVGRVSGLEAGLIHTVGGLLRGEALKLQLIYES